VIFYFLVTPGVKNLWRFKTATDATKDKRKKTKDKRKKKKGKREKGK